MSHHGYAGAIHRRADSRSVPDSELDHVVQNQLAQVPATGPTRCRGALGVWSTWTRTTSVGPRQSRWGALGGALQGGQDCWQGNWQVCWQGKPRNSA